MSSEYDEWFNVLDIREIQKEYLNWKLEGCFRLYDDGGEGAIDKAEVPTWESVLEMLKTVEGIGIEKDDRRVVTIGMDPEPENKDPNNVYIQFNGDYSITELIKVALRMRPDRIVVNDADKYPDFLSAYVFVRDMIIKNVFRPEFFEVNFSLNQITHNSSINHLCYIEPVFSTLDHKIVEDLGEGRMLSIYNGTVDDCSKIFDSLVGLHVKYSGFKVDWHDMNEFYKHKVLEIMEDVLNKECDGDKRLWFWGQRNFDSTTLTDVIEEVFAGNYDGLKGDLDSETPLENILREYVYLAGYEDEEFYFLLSSVSDAVHQKEEDIPGLRDFWRSVSFEDKKELLKDAGYRGLDYWITDLIAKDDIQTKEDLWGYIKEKEDEREKEKQIPGR